MSKNTELPKYHTENFDIRTLVLVLQYFDTSTKLLYEIVEPYWYLDYNLRKYRIPKVPKLLIFIYILFLSDV